MLSRESATVLFVIDCSFVRALRHDYTYLAPAGALSSAQAVSKAKQLLLSRGIREEDLGTASVIRQFLPANGFFDSVRGAQCAAGKKVPYGYSVTFKHWVVFVGDSGDILGGGKIK